MTVFLRYLLACLGAGACFSAAAARLEIVNQTHIAAPMPSNGNSVPSYSLSADASHILFYSEASNLVPGDTNKLADLFVRDQGSGISERVNVAGNGAQANGETGLVGDISDDGRYVAFYSSASNLVDEDTYGAWQIYLRDRAAATTTLLSRDSHGRPSPTGSYAPQMSADGRYVLFETGDALLPADTNSYSDVYRLDLTTQTLTLVSVSAAGAPGNGNSLYNYLSRSGRHAVFLTAADNLVANDQNHEYDLVLRDLDSGVNTLVSRRSDGSQIADLPILAWDNAVSEDGRYVVFNSYEALDPADTNNAMDGFRFDALDGSVTRITQGPGAAVLGQGGRVRAISRDGRRVLLESSSGNLPGALPAGYERPYLRDLASGDMQLVSLRAGPPDVRDETLGCTLSYAGSAVFCASRTARLAEADDNGFTDVFLTDFTQVTWVSQPLSGAAAYANHHSAGYSLGGADASQDGRFVAFESQAGNLVVGDTNGTSDVFVRDRLTATTTRISLGNGGTQSYCASANPLITPDGRYVVFSSCSLMPSGGSGGFNQVFRHDQLTGELLLVSSGVSGAPGNSESRPAGLSADGNVISFVSNASNLIDDPPHWGVYVRNVVADSMQLVSQTQQGGHGNGFPSGGEVTGDGRQVFFSDTSSNLVPGDTNDSADVFAFNLYTGALRRVSLDNQGQQLRGPAYAYGVSHDGGQLLYWNNSPLCSGPGFLVRNLASGISECVSRHNTGAALTSPSDAVISADGSRVAFAALDITDPEAAAWWVNIFVFDRGAQRLHRITPAAMNADAQLLNLCPDGSCLLFYSAANNLVSDDGNNRFRDVFLAADFGDEDRLFADGFDTDG
jgi:Tol biopolymer transport system component